MTKFIKNDFYEFFKSLASNNHKEWFDANRKQYESAVKLPFEQLCNAILIEMSKNDKSYSLQQPKDVIYRINRDIRFSKDKTPYKLNRSALFSPGGKKDMNPGGFYLELGPGGNHYYAGVYMPERPELAKIRRHMANHLDGFQKLISAKAFKDSFGEVKGEKNKRLDTELREAAEKQPLMYNTQFYIQHELSDEICMSNHLVDELMRLQKTATPYLSFMTEAMGLEEN